MASGARCRTAAILRAHLDLNSIDHSYVITDAILPVRRVSPDEAFRGASEVWTRREDQDPSRISPSGDRDRGWSVDRVESADRSSKMVISRRAIGDRR